MARFGYTNYGFATHFNAFAPSAVALPLLQTATIQGADDANTGIVTSDTFDLGTGDATWEFWFRTTDTTTAQRFMDTRGLGTFGTVEGWQVALGITTTDVFGLTAIDAGDGSYVSFSTTSYTVRDGVWHHGAITWKNSTATLALYIDGVFRENGTVTGTMAGKDISNGNSIALANATNSSAQPLNGNMCELRIWNVARSAEQIRENMWRALIPADNPNLVHYWRGNGSSENEITHTHGIDGSSITYPTNFTPFRSSSPYEMLMHEVLQPDVYWPLGDQSNAFNVMQTGTSVQFNYSRTGTPATNVNGLQGYSDATVEQAWDLQGSAGNGTVAVTSAPMGVSPDIWSVAAWIEPDLVGPRSWFETRQSAGGNSACACSMTSAFKIQAATSADSPTVLESTTTLVAGKRYFVVITHNGTTNARKIYINGVLDASDSGAVNYTLSNQGTVGIGRRVGNLNDQPWDGRIQHVSCWGTTELSADDVLLMYLVGSAGRYRDVVLSDAPSFYYRLNETSGSTAIDETGNLNGTYIATPPLNQGPLLNYGGAQAERDVGSSVTFTTANTDRVDLSGGPETLAHNTNSCSYEAWFKTTTSTSGPRVWGLGDNSIGATNPLFDVGLNQGTAFTLDTNKIVLIRRNLAGTSNAAEFTTGGTHRDGNPHHLVITYNGTNALVYFDGVEVINMATTVDVGTAFDTCSIAAVRRNNNNVDLQLEGTVAEWAAYNFALSADRVRAHYLAGKATSKYTAAVGSTGPVAFWKLDETSGTQAIDEVNQVNGVYTGSPTLGDTSLIGVFADTNGKAMTTDSSNYMLVTDATLMSLFDGTSSNAHEFVCKTTDSTQGAVPVGPGASSNNNQLFNIQFNQTHSGATPVNNPNFIELVRRSSGGTLNTANVNLSGEHRDGSPHRYVVTYDGTNGKVYFDSSTPSITLASTLDLGTAIDQFTVGGLTRVSFLLGVTGTLDEVILYDFVPSETRFTSHRYLAR